MQSSHSLLSLAASPRLQSLPLRHIDHYHQLVLQSFDKHRHWESQHCRVCYYHMNGLFYAFGGCSFKVDIKCACMPDTIHHAAHPQHLLKHAALPDVSCHVNRKSMSCAARCGSSVYYDCYACISSSCDFIVHVGCTLLPASVSSRRWDKHHPLLLADARRHSQSSWRFLHRLKSWMYHCRACNISFHLYCLQTTSGQYRNMKLGQEYVNPATHPHRLTFQLLTTKRRCDLCRGISHGCQGFYCAPCDFFICLLTCGKQKWSKMGI
ncbi:uncharacterized protein LOC121780603 [Salvia splendens]|uniref:uncharacterized protein LOC121780603 n=1 Tax=Salvia splendens TaxID=180675 RepID=UPI001C26BEFC|nr:uncharacterized protein LOC121780603 [Salvia splendens]